MYRSGEGEFSFESAYTFRVISNPFHSIYALHRIPKNPIDYNFATQLVAARYRLSNAKGPGWLRGSWESSATVVGTSIVQGPESYFLGLALGLRYDFIQNNARLVPFVEMRSGPGTTDSSGRVNGQQQDLIFTYLFSAGARYQINPGWSISASAIDQHLSNANLAPRSYGVDSVGVSLGVFSHF